MEEASKELEEKEVTAAAGGGAVEVTVSGKKEVTKVKIDPEAVDPDDVEVGTIIVVKPGERIPLDGVVIEGESLIDTAALTGESVPRRASEGDEIISGCVNGSGTLKIRTTKEFDDSTVAKILELVENASSKKAKVENFITRFAKYYTPVVTIGAVLLAVIPPLILGGGFADEMKDFLENEDTSDFSHTRMNIYFRELGNESPLLVKLIMRSIYKNNDRKVRHLGSKRFGIQFLIKGIYTYNGMLYVHTQTKNSSNVPFDTDFIKFKIVDKKVPKRTAIQETVLDAVRSYNEVIEIAGKSTVRTVYALPKFTIPDDKLLVVELYEKNGGRHQTIRVENADIVNAEVIDELKIK